MDKDKVINIINELLWALYQAEHYHDSITSAEYRAVRSKAEKVLKELKG